MVAGVIAGAANNNLCGVGLAYNAKIAGMSAVKVNNLQVKSRIITTPVIHQILSPSYDWSKHIM